MAGFLHFADGDANHTAEKENDSPFPPLGKHVLVGCHLLFRLHCYFILNVTSSKTAPLTIPYLLVLVLLSLACFLGAGVFS